jgi:hypothetical protein
MFNQSFFFHGGYNKERGDYNKMKCKINYFSWNKISKSLSFDKIKMSVKPIKERIDYGSKSF